MTDSTILYLIKFFEDERHADQFIAGDLYLSPLSCFKKLENESDDGRFDSTEAVSMWFQPNDTLIEITIPGIGKTVISKDDLAAPTSMSFAYHDYVHVLCLYAVQISGFEIVDGKIRGNTEEMRRQLTIDKRCLKFGKHAVVINKTSFLKTLRDALRKQDRKFKYKLVEYYDEATFHGVIPQVEIPFRKQKRFRYQQEFRVCVYPAVKHNSPITIKIGNISSSCHKMKSSELDSVWRFDPSA